MLKLVAMLQMTQHIVSKICCREIFISEKSCTQDQNQPVDSLALN